MSALVFASLLMCAGPAVDAEEATPPGSSSPSSDRAEPIGVVRVARDRVLAYEAGESSPPDGSTGARTGDLIALGTSIETGPAGWAEIHVLDAGRVRLSASTRATFERKGGAHVVRLSGGRVWLQRPSGRPPGAFAGLEGQEPSSVEIDLLHASVVVEERSSVIVERTRTLGGFVAVRAGSARLVSPDRAWAPVVLGTNQVAILGPERVDARPVARMGGAGIAELVVLEAQQGLGDLIGVRAFLLEGIARSSVRALERRGLSEIVRGEAEISGADPGGVVIEDAVRPAPFFEDEVPPKGPNVRVEVMFGDE